MSSAGAPGGAGRYAPTPSGDLHLGNLRTALLAWLFARSTQRRFLMRVEDLDRARDAGTAHRQLADLAAIGLDWDGDVRFQTAMHAGHERAIAVLDTAGLVYECTCTRREILAAPSAPHGAPGAYPGTCRDRTDAERVRERERIAPRLPALRLRAPEPYLMHGVRYADAVLGAQHGDVDDLVLQRGDGTVAYNLAVVVDDAASGIDQVVRGDDLAPSTPRQIMLQRLLGLPIPEYAHVPLVLGPSGERLAKRDGAVTLRELVDDGVGVDRIRGLLAGSLGLAEPGERPSAGRMLERFDPAHMTSAPWTFVPGALEPGR